MNSSFRSLRFRLLVPLLVVALVATLAVALGSIALGDRWARQQVESRFRGIEATLSEASFPLTKAVIESIAQLTNTELVAIDSSGVARQSSVALPEQMNWNSVDRLARSSDEYPLIEIEHQRFLSRAFSLRNSSNSDVSRVIVLFDDADVRGWRHRAALLPLLTGLSTIALLTSVVLWMIGRLIGRLSRLQQKVNSIAEGEFDITIDPETNDEVGMLANSVSQMNRQLAAMWTTLERQQGEKLLHQVAGGLAHQLRNSITGARMAVELHQRGCDHADESLEVAVSQLEHTEQHVRRLLMVAAGKQDEDRPQSIQECIRDVKSAVSTTAAHLGIELIWSNDQLGNSAIVADGPSFSAALSNLIFNAMHEGTEVQIAIHPCLDSQDISSIRVDVTDNGDGPHGDVASEIFEPFVTSKPEGLGLGLPLVARSTRRLGGTVEWCREGDYTRFTMTLPVQNV